MSSYIVVIGLLIIIAVIIEMLFAIKSLWSMVGKLTDLVSYLNDRVNKKK